MSQQSEKSRFEERLDTIVTAIFDLQRVVSELAVDIYEQNAKREEMGKEIAGVEKMVEDRKKGLVVDKTIHGILEGDRKLREATNLRKRLGYVC